MNKSVLTKDFLKYYVLPLSMIWLLGLCFLMLKGYNESFLVLNKWHTTCVDFPMLMLTMLGDAGFMSVLFIFLMIKKQPYQLIMLLIAIIISGILAQLLKHNVFSQWHRPPFLLKDEVHTVGKYILNHFSFPSGHSTTVAAGFTMLAFFRRQYKSELLVYALLCSIVAYTRIYLGVHFLGDVVAGILLGFSCSMLIIFLLKPFHLNLKPVLIITLRIIAVIAAVVILGLFCKEYL
jgi:undecaprenyl-diphosphatase